MCKLKRCECCGSDKMYTRSKHAKFCEPCSQTIKQLRMYLIKHDIPHAIREIKLQRVYQEVQDNNELLKVQEVI